MARSYPRALRHPPSARPDSAGVEEIALAGWVGAALRATARLGPGGGGVGDRCRSGRWCGCGSGVVVGRRLLGWEEAAFAAGQQRSPGPAVVGLAVVAASARPGQ